MKIVCCLLLSHFLLTTAKPKSELDFQAFMIKIRRRENNNVNLINEKYFQKDEAIRQRIAKLKINKLLAKIN